MKHPNFSFGLFLHNGISPGILDKNDKACSLSACFLQNGISAGILDKARSLTESQPVGLAEVIDASEASLGGPGGRPSQTSKNRVK